MPGASQWPAFTSTVFLVKCHSCDVVATHCGGGVTQRQTDSCGFPISTLPLQPLLSPFIPIPACWQHLLMPAADPHPCDTLCGSSTRTSGDTRSCCPQTVTCVTSSRMGFRTLATIASSSPWISALSFVIACAGVGMSEKYFRISSITSSSVHVSPMVPMKFCTTG